MIILFSTLSGLFLGYLIGKSQGAVYRNKLLKAVLHAEGLICLFETMLARSNNNMFDVSYAKRQIENYHKENDPSK